VLLQLFGAGLREKNPLAVVMLLIAVKENQLRLLLGIVNGAVFVIGTKTLTEK
jgi:hypothetical protein